MGEAGSLVFMLAVALLQLPVFAICVLMVVFIARGDGSEPIAAWDDSE